MFSKNKVLICILFILIMLSICPMAYAETKAISFTEIKVGDTLICQRDIPVYSTFTFALFERYSCFKLKEGEEIKVKTRIGSAGGFIKFQSTSSKKIACVYVYDGMFAKNIEENKEKEKTIDVTNDNILGYKGYYTNLSDREKVIYGYFYNQVLNLGYTKINFSSLKNQLGGMSSSEIKDALKALNNDHPDFLYRTNGSYRWIGTMMYFGSRTSPSLEQINAVADEIVNRYKNRSDYEKIKGAHDEICKLMTYKRGTSDYIDRFVYGTGDCTSYAYMYKYLLNKLNVKCLFVEGNTNGTGHAWNYVELNGKWYLVDVCWDDTRGDNEYFLRGASVHNTRSVWSKYIYPNVSTTDYFN